MKIQELIDYLSQFNPDHKVVVDGYEDGYVELKEENLTQVGLDWDRNKKTDKDAWWLGPHSLLFEYSEVNDEREEVTAVLLSRRKCNLLHEIREHPEKLSSFRF